MQCPLCPTLLMKLEVGGLELDECPRCLGMWFDPGELQRLVNEALAATRGLPQRYLPPTGDEKVPARSACPRCVTGRLVERDEAGHLIAGCARCGGAWVPGTLLSYILSVEDIPEDLAELESLAEVGGPIGDRPDLAPTPPLGTFSIAAPQPVPPPPPSVGFARRAAIPRAPTGACPACGHRFFDAVMHEGQGFHRCGRCEGLFFARGALPQFLSGNPRSWTAPPSVALPEPQGTPACAAAGCGQPMNVMRWQDRPVRIWACQGCWSTFASAEGVRRLVAPERYQEEDTQSKGALALWRAFDAFTDWLARPPSDSAYRLLQRRR